MTFFLIFIFKAPEKNSHGSILILNKFGSLIINNITMTIACLTVYDMCKAVDREMKISNIQLNYKSGGKSGVFKKKVK